MARAVVFGVVLISLLAFLSLQPALAKSFKGMVLEITAYSITIQHSLDDIKIFQVRGETRRSPNIAVEDIVEVNYRDENGILIAKKIEVKRKTRK